MDFLENAAIANTLALPCRARWLVEANTREEVHEAMAWAQEQGVRVLPLGSGSNVVLPEKIDALVLKLCNRGIAVADDQVTAEAGENWHGFVEASMKLGRYGLENLALIPGQVGAAPIQNIGAYGVEVAQWIRAVHVTDRHSGKREQLTPDACEFGYRDSVFKREAGAHWIVSAVEFALDREAPVQASYPSLQNRLASAALSHDAVLAAVMSIRRERLPDPVVTPNVGSFFKNPLLCQDQADKLAQKEPGLPVYPTANGFAKISAAWLIDRLGWRGVEHEGVKVSDDHALVLVGCGATTAAPWLALADEITASVRAAFNVTLEREPQLMGTAAETSVT